MKGHGAGRRSLIAEWVAGHLALALNLPVAHFALAEVPEEIVAAKVRADIGELGAGLVFASRKYPNVQELTPTTRDRVPQTPALDVLVFDMLAQNEDRNLTEQGGNPNLLWDVAGAQLVVIDHNQAFDPDFDARRLLDGHVFAHHWNTVLDDHDLRVQYLERMDKALQCLPEARASMPEAWWWVGEGVPASLSWDAVKTCLERYRREDFWNLP